MIKSSKPHDEQVDDNENDDSRRNDHDRDNDSHHDNGHATIYHRSYSITNSRRRIPCNWRCGWVEALLERLWLRML